MARISPRLRPDLIAFVARNGLSDARISELSTPPRALCLQATAPCGAQVELKARYSGFGNDASLRVPTVWRGGHVEITRHETTWLRRWVSTQLRAPTADVAFDERYDVYLPHAIDAAALFPTDVRRWVLSLNFPSFAIHHDHVVLAWSDDSDAPKGGSLGACADEALAAGLRWSRALASFGTTVTATYRTTSRVADAPHADSWRRRFASELRRRPWLVEFILITLLIATLAALFVVVAFFWRRVPPVSTVSDLSTKSVACAPAEWPGRSTR